MSSMEIKGSLIVAPSAGPGLETTYIARFSAHARAVGLAGSTRPYRSVAGLHEAGPLREHDGLGAVAEPELVEDASDLTAEGRVGLDSIVSRDGEGSHDRHAR